MGSAPDYLDPTVGWRAWLVVEYGEAMRLSSVIYPTLWPPRREVRACFAAVAGRSFDPGGDRLATMARPRNAVAA